MAVETQVLHGYMTRPYSEATRLRSINWISLSPLRVRDASACLTPFDGKLIIGIGKALSGPFRAWRFAGILVSIPRDLGQAINLDLHRIKCRIIKTLAVPTFEFVFIELRG